MATHAPPAGRRRIVVVGSCNMDLVVRAPRLPLPGETISGTGFQCLPGGKGANQAVAAARLGGAVSMVACVGRDGFGEQMCVGLAADGIDLSQLRRHAGLPTGIAVITVGGDGANSIVLAAGANAALSAQDVAQAEPLIAHAALLVCQLEVPLPTVQAAIELAARHHTPVLLNPAPAVPLDAALLSRVDYLVPNETEAALLAGQPVHDVQSARRVAAVLREQGARHVLLTLGAGGVWLESEQVRQQVAAPRVQAVDTTAAGDTFIGGFAARLAEGASLLDAVRFGQSAAAISVSRFGAQASIPHRAEVDAQAPDS